MKFQGFVFNVVLSLIVTYVVGALMGTGFTGNGFAAALLGAFIWDYIE